VLLAIIFSLVGALASIFHGCKGSSMRSDGAVLQVLTGVFGIIATALWIQYDTPNEKCETIETLFSKTHTCYWAFSVFTAGWAVSMLSAILMAFT